jgi:hypothetical protein
VRGCGPLAQGGQTLVSQTFREFLKPDGGEVRAPAVCQWVGTDFRQVVANTSPPWPRLVPEPLRRERPKHSARALPRLM